MKGAVQLVHSQDASSSTPPFMHEVEHTSQLGPEKPPAHLHVQLAVRVPLFWHTVLHWVHVAPVKPEPIGQSHLQFSRSSVLLFWHVLFVSGHLSQVGPVNGFRQCWQVHDFSLNTLPCLHSACESRQPSQVAPER
jgi:hypothetical protein